MAGPWKLWDWKTLSNLMFIWCCFITNNFTRKLHNILVYSQYISRNLSSYYIVPIAHTRQMRIAYDF